MIAPRKRPAALAGKWYPAARSEINAYLPFRKPVQNAIGAICPHAGWTYSGRIAAEVYAALPQAEVFVLIGVNHRGEGHSISVPGPGLWETPAGPLTVDETISEQLMKECSLVQKDPEAHQREHSLEVQTPFLAHRFPKAKIVPILMYDYNWKTCTSLSRALTTILKKDNRRILMIATSDFSHVGPDYGQVPPKGITAPAFARAQDEKALNCVRALDPAGLLKTVEASSITMCGAGPVAVVLATAKELGANKAEVLAQGTSSDVSQDIDTCVDYAAILLSRSGN